MIARRDTAFLAPAIAVVTVTLLAPMLLLFVISFWTVRSFRLQPAASLDAWHRFVVNYGGLTLYTVAIGIAVAASLALFAFTGMPGDVHVIWSYEWRALGPDSGTDFSQRHYTRCTYVGAHRAITAPAMATCGGWVGRSRNATRTLPVSTQRALKAGKSLVCQSAQ